MIERQIERLAPDEQQVLEAASVVGMEFTAAAVEAALEEPEGASEERCDRLARQQRFLYAREPKMWPDGTVTASYAFTHTLYQNVLSQRVAAVRRLRLHQRIGERLEAVYGAQADVIAAELAIHFEQGRVYPRAIHYLQRAAEQATRRYANREAAIFVARIRVGAARAGSRTGQCARGRFGTAWSRLAGDGEHASSSGRFFCVGYVYMNWDRKNVKCWRCLTWRRRCHGLIGRNVLTQSNVLRN
jgi:hypothetical protein